jgi:tetratricopeptide (TPR) repeat protein
MPCGRCKRLHRNCTFRNERRRNKRRDSDEELDLSVSPDQPFNENTGADPISPSPPAHQKPEALPMPLSSESYLNTMAFANAFASAFSATSEGFIYSLPNLDVAAIQNSNDLPYKFRVYASLAYGARACGQVVQAKQLYSQARMLFSELMDSQSSIDLAIGAHVIARLCSSNAQFESAAKFFRVAMESFQHLIRTIGAETLQVFYLLTSYYYSLILPEEEEAGKIAFDVWDAIAKLESESALKVRTLLSFGLTARILTLRNDVLTASFFFQQWKKLCSFVPQTQFTRIRCLRGESFINAMTSLLAGDYNAAKENLGSWLELMNDPTGVIYDFPTVHQYFMVGKMFAICHDWHSVDFIIKKMRALSADYPVGNIIADYLLKTWQAAMAYQSVIPDVDPNFPADFQKMQFPLQPTFEFAPNITTGRNPEPRATQNANVNTLIDISAYNSEGDESSKDGTKIETTPLSPPTTPIQVIHITQPFTSFSPFS